MKKEDLHWDDMMNVIGEANKYISRIRNARKKEYAKQWLNYRLGKAEKPETNKISYMAAQAVRIEIDQMIID